MRGAVEFEDRLAREEGVVGDGDGGDELQRGGLGDSGTPHVRYDLDTVGVCQGEDVTAGREAARGTEVGLGDIDAALADQITEAKQGVLVFAAGDGNVDGGFD